MRATEESQWAYSFSARHKRNVENHRIRIQLGYSVNVRRKGGRGLKNAQLSGISAGQRSRESAFSTRTCNRGMLLQQYFSSQHSCQTEMLKVKVGGDALVQNIGAERREIIWRSDVE